jgi:hypothetical protein
MVDSDQQQRLTYQRMHFGEFLDFIARLMMVVFEQTEMVKILPIDKLKFGFASMFDIVGEKIVDS